MTRSEPFAWPPAPIKTERLVLREPEARDREALIDLFSSPEVSIYTGGPRDRDELRRVMPDPPRRRPGLFVVDLAGAMIGVVMLDPRDPERQPHIPLRREFASSATSSCHKRGATDTPWRHAVRHWPGSAASCRRDGWC